MDLTMEQDAYLHLLHQKAQAMSREQLIAELMACEEQRLIQLGALTDAMYRFGGVVQATATELPPAPDADELQQIFGYAPTEDEAWEYYRTLDELSTMDVDLEAVVIDGPAEEELELEELSRWRN
jgi:hypothetical protein